jgi:ferredoxin
MTYVIALPCVDLLDKTCIAECPVEAISFEADTPAQFRVFQAVNAEFFHDLGSPGGASAIGKIRKDHPIVAGLPPQR